MNWNDLPVALAIARAGSLSGAAALLGRNHSTVFRRLKALEADLGVRLFDRLPTGYAPTSVGRALLARAEEAADAVDALARQAQGMDRRPSGEVRLTTAPDLAVDFVPDALVALARTHAGIRVEVVVSDSEYDLSRREADLALRATGAPPEHLVGRKVADLTWHVAGSAGYLAAHPAPVTEECLHHHRFIGADAAFAQRPALRWLHERVPRTQIVAAANTLSVMAALARTGLGLAVLPSDHRDPDLQRLLPVPLATGGALWLLTHPDLRNVARIRAVADVLFETVRGKLAT